MDSTMWVPALQVTLPCGVVTHVMYRYVSSVSQAIQRFTIKSSPKGKRKFSEPHSPVLCPPATSTYRDMSYFQFLNQELAYFWF